MRKNWYALLMILCVTSLFSCKDDNETVIDEVWRQQNEEVINQLQFNSDYNRISAESGNDYVYYKSLQEGTGKKIFYTSQVQVYYKGTLIDGTEFDARLFEDGEPFKCAVSSAVADYNYYSNPDGYQSVIEGWTVALQHMVEGDKWEVYIPYELGYGEVDNGDIPACSTLIFEIEVVSVDQQ